MILIQNNKTQIRLGSLRDEKETLTNVILDSSSVKIHILNAQNILQFVVEFTLICNCQCQHRMFCATHVPTSGSVQVSSSIFQLPICQTQNILCLLNQPYYNCVYPCLDTNLGTEHSVPLNQPYFNHVYQ